MLLYHLQNAGQSQDIKTATRPFENLSQFKYLGTTVTNQNLIRRKLNSGNDWYHSVQEPFNCCLKT
jgi:hypothetical protein